MRKHFVEVDETRIICKKDCVEAKPIKISSYEYEPGVPSQNVAAFECPKCKEFIFTPAQVEEMEARSRKASS